MRELSILRRTLVIAALLLAAAGTRASAANWMFGPPLCPCDGINIVVSPALACDITVCPSAPTIRFVCFTANSSMPPHQVPCVDQLDLSFSGPCGNIGTLDDIPNNPLPQCISHLAIAPGCCVDICAAINPFTGCIEVGIRPSPGKCPC